MLVEAIQGERRAGQNVQTDGRSGPYSEFIVNDVGFGRFFEATRNGRMFSVSTANGATLNANATPLAAAGTPVLALYNPKGNTKAAVILKAVCQYTVAASATVFAPVWEYRNTVEALTAAGSDSAISGLIGQGSSSTMRFFIASALTGATVASALLRPWEGAWGEPRHPAAAAETGAAIITEDTDGRIIVPPGALINVAFTAAGAAVTGSVAISYAEVDYSAVL